MRLQPKLPYDALACKRSKNAFEMSVKFRRANKLLERKTVKCKKEVATKCMRKRAVTYYFITV